MTSTQTLVRDVTSDVSRPKEISFTFQTNQSDMTAYPRASVIKELTARIRECGDYLCDEYNVIVSETKDIPYKFFWKPYALGTKGRGFYLGPITENGINYPGRCYTLQSPHISELSQAIDLTVERFVPPPEKSGPKKLTAVPSPEPNLHTRFLTGFAGLLKRQGSSTIAIKDTDKGTFFSDLMRLSYGCADDAAIKAQIQMLVGMELLSQVPSTKPWLKLYGFGQGARKHLPEQLKSLVGVSLMAPRSPSPDAIETAAVPATSSPAVVDAPVAIPTPSTDLQDRVALFAKTKRYKELAEAETTRANTVEAALAVVRQENSSLQAMIQDFNHQVEVLARALLDQMIKDL